MRKKISAVLCAGVMMGMLYGGSAFAATQCDSWGVDNPPAAGAPPAPTNVQVTPGSGQMTVTWGAVGSADTYNVWYTDCASTVKKKAVAPPDTTTTITGLADGTYQVRVSTLDIDSVSSTKTAVIEVTVGGGVVTTTTTAAETTTTTAAATTTTTAAETTTTTAAETTTTTAAATTTTTAAATTTTTTAAPLADCPTLTGYNANKSANGKTGMDVNNDGAVNAYDAALIVRFIKNCK